jgi:CheY-like chemotaxis protein
MGGEISIKEKQPGERGTCFAFNVLLKMSERQEPQDIEEGTSAPSDPLTHSNFRASALQEACSSFKGFHCILYVHGGETVRILQAWMESIGVKVWLVRHPKSIASTMENLLHNGTTTPPARASPSPATGDEGSDRCFGSKEMVSHVLPALRNSTGPRRGSHGGNLCGILAVIDVSGGESEDIFLEMEKLARIRHQALPCKVVLLDDIRTPSDDLRRFKELGCDLVLRKPVHGSRLFTLLTALRDLQDSDAPAHYSQVGPEIADTSHQQQDLPEIVLHGPQEAAASTETATVAQDQKPEDEKPMAGMQVLLVEDTLVLQTIQRKLLSQLGATVRVAQDGAVAVNLFKEALEQAIASEEGVMSLPYSVIFMDCQVCSAKICYYASAHTKL